MVRVRSVTMPRSAPARKLATSPGGRRVTVATPYGFDPRPRRDFHQTRRRRFPSHRCSTTRVAQRNLAGCRFTRRSDWVVKRPQWAHHALFPRVDRRYPSWVLLHRIRVAVPVNEPAVAPSYTFRPIVTIVGALPILTQNGPSFDRRRVRLPPSHNKQFGGSFAGFARVTRSESAAVATRPVRPLR